MKLCSGKAHVRRSSHGCPSKCQSMGDRTCHCHSPALVPIPILAPSLHNCLSKGWRTCSVICRSAWNNSNTRPQQLSDNFMNYSNLHPSAAAGQAPATAGRERAGPSPARPLTKCPVVSARSALPLSLLLFCLLAPRRRSCGLSSVSVLLTLSGHEVDRT